MLTEPVVQLTAWSQMVGRAISQVVDNGDSITLVFTDDSLITLAGQEGNMEVLKLSMDYNDKYYLGMISKEEFEVQRNLEVQEGQKKYREQRRKQYEQLQKEFGR